MAVAIDDRPGFGFASDAPAQDDPHARFAAFAERTRGAPIAAQSSPESRSLSD